VNVNVAAAGIGDDIYGAKQPAKSRTLVVCPTSVRDLVSLYLYVTSTKSSNIVCGCVSTSGTDRRMLSTVPFHEGSGTLEFK
jgi:hypothetical protein